MLTVSEKPTTNIELIPPGVYVANCYGVIDLGTLENKVYGGEAHKVLIQWELPECRGEFERDGETVNLPRVISKRYTLSLSEMAKLRSDLQSWRGARPDGDSSPSVYCRSHMRFRVHTFPVSWRTAATA